MYMNEHYGISLFASGGIGDLALEASGITVVLANELLPDRASIYKHNFPLTEVLVGDIWKLQDEIVAKTSKILDGKCLDFILASPPCQGMSKNGQGKLLSNIRNGKRPSVDPRNRLIIPTLNIITKLQPRVVVFENVPEMENTFIDDEDGKYVNIIDYIRSRLGEKYSGQPEVVEFADYGVPQRRKRLITVFTREQSLKELFEKRSTLLPARTHAKEPGMFLKKWVTVRDMIEKLPALSGKDKKSAISDIPYHYVPVLDPKKFIWITNTPPEKGAFDNQCINKKCNYQNNTVHGSERNNGINQAKTSTPLYCDKCGQMLPRPYTVGTDGKKRIMSGYTSAYKRMRWDLPSSTLTTNLSYPSSDHKLHPEQDRVLSLYEAFKLHTLDRFDFDWKHEDEKPARDTTIAEIIGESIPPLGLKVIFNHLTTFLETLSGDFVSPVGIEEPLLYRLKKSI